MASKEQEPEAKNTNPVIIEVGDKIKADKGGAELMDAKVTKVEYDDQRLADWYGEDSVEVVTYSGWKHHDYVTLDEIVEVNGQDVKDVEVKTAEDQGGRETITLKKAYLEGIFEDEDVFIPYHLHGEEYDLKITAMNPKATTTGVNEVIIDGTIEEDGKTFDVGGRKYPMSKKAFRGE